jgi:hypothetical protein
LQGNMGLVLIMMAYTENEVGSDIITKPKARRTSLYQILKLGLSLDVGDITVELVARWSKPISASSVDNLLVYLQQPLREEEKIPISQHTFDSLCVLYSGGSRVSALDPQQLSALFRVSADERATGIKRLFLSAITTTPPPIGTEDLFHSFYDINISYILQFILPNTTAIRNCNHQTNTALNRPDYGLLINGHCLFRGEEKGSHSTGDPAQELLKKLDELWGYYPLRYITGLL